MDRQIEILENGGVVEQQTRSFNANTGTTSLMRSKEDANDYRYFPEPDLQPVLVNEEYIEKSKNHFHHFLKSYLENSLLNMVFLNTIPMSSLKKKTLLYTSTNCVSTLKTTKLPPILLMEV